MQPIPKDDEVKPPIETIQPFRNSSPLREIKQEPMEQPYTASATGAYKVLPICLMTSKR